MILAAGPKRITGTQQLPQSLPPLEVATYCQVAGIAHQKSGFISWAKKLQIDFLTRPQWDVAYRQYQLRPVVR